MRRGMMHREGECLDAFPERVPGGTHTSGDATSAGAETSGDVTPRLQARGLGPSPGAGPGTQSLPLRCRRDAALRDAARLARRAPTCALWSSRPCGAARAARRSAARAQRGTPPPEPPPETACQAARACDAESGAHFVAFLPGQSHAGTQRQRAQRRSWFR